MPRRPRQAAGGLIFHVLNRAVGRMRLFKRDGDYAAFEKVLAEALQRFPMPLLSYSIMPNHWHLVLWPDKDGQLSQLMFWLTMTHAQRWRHAHNLVGLGPLYQGRFKSFPTQTDDHFLTLCRYTEANALRARLVRRAELWRWCSLAVRRGADSPLAEFLRPWPITEPSDWLRWVNRRQEETEVAQVRAHIRSGHPFGEDPWKRRTAKVLGINLTPRPRGRPRIEQTAAT